MPEVFELDDDMVRMPTDIIGQHIHLPKWDLPADDGSANGWNYEDGTLSPGAVRERIHAINRYNGTEPCPDGLVPGPAPVPTLDGQTTLTAQPHPFLGVGPYGKWLGARTTIQRWFADPVDNVGGPLSPTGGTLVYNPRATSLSNGKQGPLHDPTAILYVKTADLQKVGGQTRLKAGVPVEPLVLRAASGECLEVTLRNQLPVTSAGSQRERGRSTSSAPSSSWAAPT